MNLIQEIGTSYRSHTGVCDRRSKGASDMKMPRQLLPGKDHHAISGEETGWSSLTHSRSIHHASARSLRETRVLVIIEDTADPIERYKTAGFTQPSEDGQLLRREHYLVITLDTGDETLLLDLTIINPCISTSLVERSMVGWKTPRRHSRVNEKLSGLVPRYIPHRSSHDFDK